MRSFSKSEWSFSAPNLTSFSIWLTVQNSPSCHSSLEWLEPRIHLSLHLRKWAKSFKEENEDNESTWGSLTESFHSYRSITSLESEPQTQQRNYLWKTMCYKSHKYAFATDCLSLWRENSLCFFLRHPHSHILVIWESTKIYRLFEIPSKQSNTFRHRLHYVKIPMKMSHLGMNNSKAGRVGKF